MGAEIILQVYSAKGSTSKKHEMLIMKVRIHIALLTQTMVVCKQIGSDINMLASSLEQQYHHQYISTTMTPIPKLCIPLHVSK